MNGRQTPPVFISGTLIYRRYVDLVMKPVLRPFLQGFPRAVFQNDNDRSHAARDTVNSLRGLVLPCPASSPDLFPIEHVCGIIGHQLEKEITAANREALRAQVLVAQQNILQTMNKNLIDSLAMRVSACIAAHESHIPY